MEEARQLSSKAPGGIVFEQRDIEEEVPVGQLQLDQWLVALLAAVATRRDRTQVPAVGDLHHPRLIELLAEAGFPCLPVRPPAARGAPWHDHPRR